VTPRDRLFQTAVIDGGALGAIAIDLASRAVIAGYAHDGLLPAALVDLLVGATRPSGPLTQVCGGPPPNAARELMVAGRDRTLYCVIGERGELVALAAPHAMSVALGWALIRTLVSAEGPR
jgi:hypothetical protein